MFFLLTALLACRTPMTPDEARPGPSSPKMWNELLGRAVTEDGYVNYDLIEAEREVLIIMSRGWRNPSPTQRLHTFAIPIG